ncbi:putative nucleic-acid-binding protein containing a Zn-ribbon [Sterolibacterium denitrificans]|uniref:Nucleic-acid-binding protein containing a Zn-ribbon n=1 Tax=Sterolibacterium denitrificans TaxID=157592 RepID=A0A7Z7HQG3_9PROT|nr:OB-fold domain-containing protein [Sterolibacterium denitrificans]SMB25058.1 putative nucleic-acid-binding protein containing a Zn-ribbon [Sterolibacterium denitrificans]
MNLKPVPIATETSAPFWNGLRERKVNMQQCDDCGHWVFYPRAHCPACFSPRLSWKEISGKGTLLTYTLTRVPTMPEFTDEMPQKLAVVQFDEGPHVNTTLIGLEAEDIKVGMRLKPVFTDIPETEHTLLRFTGENVTIVDSGKPAAKSAAPAPKVEKRQIHWRDLPAMQSLVSEEFGPWSDELEITQQLIDEFAKLSGDDYWIHTDPERCRKESPFGIPIAQGQLVQVMVSKLRVPNDYEVVGFTNMVNYGSDKLRFPATVPVGSRIHARSRVKAVTEVKSGIQMTTEICTHVVGMERPSVINELVILFM